jgi:hypothetical protein
VEKDLIDEKELFIEETDELIFYNKKIIEEIRLFLHTIVFNVQSPGAYRMGGVWGVTPALLWKILFLLVNKIEKTVFSGVFWC